MNCRNCGQTLDDASRFCKFCGAQVPPDPDEVAAPIKIGDLLEGKWKIEKKIGQGGMGSVYIAHDTSLDRRVAIKILAPDLCNDHEFVARFEREAKATANLEHPNVVLVYAVGQHFGRPFIVMKYLEGVSLARHLKQNKGGLAPEECLAIFKQLCSGLGFIHSKGFVHRDIKSGNIFVGPDGKTTILDFGILRDTNSSQGLTRAGVVMGTPHYLAPEQALGKKIDHRADLYAVGVLLFECLTGVPPYDADNARKLIEMHLRKPPPDPVEYNPDLPPAITEVIKKALAKRVEARFQSAEELSQALDAALGEPPPEEEPEPEEEEEVVEEEPEPELARPTVRPAPKPQPPKPQPKPPDTLEQPAISAEKPKKGGFGFVFFLLLVLAGTGAVAWNLVKKEQAESAAHPDPVAKPMVDPGAAKNPQPGDPAEPPPPRPAADGPQEKAKKLLAEGRDFKVAKNYDYAIQRFIQAEELDPKNTDILYERALSHFALGEYKDAGQYFGRTLAADPKHPDARLWLVRCYAGQKMFTEAFGELKALAAGGYRELEVLESDEVLDELRREPGWREIRGLMAGGKRPGSGRPGPGSKPEEPRTDVAMMGMTGELNVGIAGLEGGPPAQVSVDGKPRGQAPLRLEMNAGEHTVVIERPGFKKFTQSVKVPLQGAAKVTAQLEKE